MAKTIRDVMSKKQSLNDDFGRYHGSAMGNQKVAANKALQKEGVKPFIRKKVKVRNG